MKRTLQVLCLLLAAALLPAALLVSRGLPADTRPYVERKYAGWNGVLRAWVCAQWSCAGGFTRWLNACAADFEKRHDGVYLEFTQVSSDELRALGEGDVRPPELVLFSPGALSDPSRLAEVEAPAGLREELRDLGGGLAYPVAMGGYIWAYNRALTSDAPEPGGPLAAPCDDAAHSYSSALVALLSGTARGEANEEAPGDAGLDLGLPASAGAAEAGQLASADALERFIAGELPAVAVSQSDLARLIQLRDAGRGPDWDCAASGQAAYTDQLLLLGAVAPSGDGAAERLALAREFGASLLEPAAQARLADVGAFSVTGGCVHTGFSPYAALDGLLNGRELLTPRSPWESAPDCAGLLRGVAGGEVAPERALSLLRQALR